MFVYARVHDELGFPPSVRVHNCTGISRHSGTQPIFWLNATVLPVTIMQPLGGQDSRGPLAYAPAFF